MNKLPISTIILTFNEETNIKACLDSVVAWSDEIFIVDSYSSDKTLEIAARYTDKICQHTFQNYALQRNWAQDNLPLKNEWVFHIDADERVDQELITQLPTIFSFRDVDGFLIPRKIVFRNRWIRHGDLYPVYHLRLFKKSRGRCEERLYDQHFVVQGKNSILDGSIINMQTPDILCWKKTHTRWAQFEAEEILFNKTGNTLMKYKGNPIEMRRWLRYKIYYKMPLFFRVFVYFFYRYVFKLGFLDGIQGTIYHVLHGFWYRFLVDRYIFKASVLKKPVTGTK